jgi:hypothetical protein
MNRISAILLITLMFYTLARSQDVKIKNINEKCKCRATLLDSIVTQLKSNSTQLTDNTYIRNNPVDVKERIDFLNSDFGTKSFARACEVRCADFTVENKFHFGIIDMGIQANDKNKCLQAIKSSLRYNFKTKVLTKFKVIERMNELVIIYSETPHDPAIEKIFSTE